MFCAEALTAVFGVVVGGDCAAKAQGAIAAETSTAVQAKCRISVMDRGAAHAVTFTITEKHSGMNSYLGTDCDLGGLGVGKRSRLHRLVHRAVI